jgi:hypothetical protein
MSLEIKTSEEIKTEAWQKKWVSVESLKHFFREHEGFSSDFCLTELITEVER